MTRIEAEQLAYVQAKSDPANHHVATPNPLKEGDWIVAAMPIHMHRYLKPRHASQSL